MLDTVSTTYARQTAKHRIPALKTNIIKLFEKRKRNVFEILEHLLYMFDSFSART